MFLKTLTLKGFKSFAEATTLEFEPGVTVVVGPNGSGKSNVVDAIAWVLGAQAPSAVRSQKMDDVIFAGTTGRPALGRAEVALTIDNSAGLLRIAFTEVRITRTLFRTGDSEYAINGVPCRLLDVQELLSDTGVGRQQHVIVSQGQIDAVLNARPEERRLLIEEAAGVLKFRRRKEKAERRLASTEANLTRVQDLLREVRRSLRPLERQADAARRHGDLVAELSTLRVHLAGRELATLRRRLVAGTEQRVELQRQESARRAGLVEGDTAIAAIERELMAAGASDLGDRLVRVEGLRERARGLAAVLAERRRGLERERGALLDAAVVATLEAEAARVTSELDEVDAAAATLASARADLDAEWTEDDDALVAGTAAEARGELAALRRGAERAGIEIARQQAQLAALDGKVGRWADERVQIEAEVASGEARAVDLAAAWTQADVVRVDAERALDAADRARQQADADHHAWAARADALALALDQARARAGAERLADVDGVIGTVLDLVAIDEGWEAAFEAAAGEALAAVVVEDVEAGRRALAELHRGDLPGAVLALGSALPVRLFPTAGEPLRHHVRAARPEVEELLDTLVGGAVVVDGGWAAALDLHLAHPDALIVTRAGDRFGPTGWRVGGPGTVATGAALDEARLRAASAAVAANTAAERLREMRAACTDAQRAEEAARHARDANEARLVSRRTAATRTAADERDAATDAEALRAHVGELAARLERDANRVAELEAGLPDLEWHDQRTAAGIAQRTDLDARASSLDERRRYLRQRQDEIEARLVRDADERERAAERREAVDRRQVAVSRLAAFVADRLARAETALADLQDERRRQSDHTRSVTVQLDELRRRRGDDERALEEVRERLRRAELDETEVRLREENAVEALRNDLACEPDVAMASEAPPLSGGVTAVQRARELDRELRLLGPINPLALEEFQALQERHEFVQKQLDDVKTTRRELAKVIRAVDEEIVSVFAAAFADVSANFVDLFETLFPGGQGRLRLTDPDELLTTGIEVEAKPSGKNVKKLSLLSGGERSLTALAFLFAVFRSRPSPFYVMDEVEAALDDVNLHRFLDLVHEFRSEAQLIIVSHQKRTMEAADCLYGVTMQPAGSSKVLSERASRHA